MRTRSTICVSLRSWRVKLELGNDIWLCLSISILDTLSLGWGCLRFRPFCSLLPRWRGAVYDPSVIDDLLFDSILSDDVAHSFSFDALSVHPFRAVLTLEDRVVEILRSAARAHQAAGRERATGVVVCLTEVVFSSFRNVVVNVLFPELD